MIKVTVLYPNEEGKTFNFDYWTGQHMETVHRLLGPYRLEPQRTGKGRVVRRPQRPCPFLALANLYFNTTDEVHEGFKNHGREILGDIKNYTDISPQFQISEVL